MTTRALSKIVAAFLLASGVGVLAGRALRREPQGEPNAVPIANLPTERETDLSAQSQEKVARALDRSAVSSPEGTGSSPGSSASSPTHAQNDHKSRRDRLHDQMIYLASAKGWAQLYESLSTADLRAERATLEASIVDMVRTEFDKRFDAGQYEVLSTGTVYRATTEDYDPCDVSWVRIPPDGPVQKCTLPEEDFPTIYEIKAQSAWIQNAIEARTLQEGGSH